MVHAVADRRALHRVTVQAGAAVGATRAAGVGGFVHRPPNRSLMRTLVLPCRRSSISSRPGPHSFAWFVRRHHCTHRCGFRSAGRYSGWPVSVLVMSQVVQVRHQQAHRLVATLVRAVRPTRPPPRQRRAPASAACGRSPSPPGRLPSSCRPAASPGRQRGSPCTARRSPRLARTRCNAGWSGRRSFLSAVLGFSPMNMA